MRRLMWSPGYLCFALLPFFASLACTQPSGMGGGGYYPPTSDINPIFGDSGDTLGWDLEANGDAGSGSMDAAVSDAGELVDAGEVGDAGLFLDSKITVDSGQSSDIASADVPDPDVGAPDGSGGCPADCPNGPQCTAFKKAEICNAIDDDCDGETDEQTCDDDNLCTKDACDGIGGCKHVSLSDGAFCGVNKACSGGICAPLSGNPKPPTLGGLVISEMMIDPKAATDASGEWFEVYNASGGPLLLDGLTISDLAGDTPLKGQDIILKPGARLVLGRQLDLAKNGNVPVSAIYTKVGLNNASPEALKLSLNGALIDKVTWTPGAEGWPKVLPGVSWQLSSNKLDAVSNDASSAWCLATMSMANGDKGSPGQGASACP